MKYIGVFALLLLLAAQQSLAMDMYKSDGRFYSGDPLPPEQVALIIGDYWDILTGDFCPGLKALAEEGKPARPLFMGKIMVEVLPGHYSVELSCKTESAYMQAWNRITLYKPAIQEIDAKPGHIYYISIDLKHGMAVSVADLTRDNPELSQINKGGLLKQVDKYFRGKRHEVHEMRLTKNPNEVPSWN